MMVGTPTPGEIERGDMMRTFFVEYIDGYGNIGVAEVRAVDSDQAIRVVVAQGAFQGFDYRVLRVGVPSA